MIIKKKVYRIKKLYPGINKEILLDDVFIKVGDDEFHQRINKEEEEVFTDKRVYITSGITNKEYFEEFYINIEI